MLRRKRDSTRRTMHLAHILPAMLPLLMAVLLLTQTASAKNTFVITDGSRVLVHTTHASNPKQVLDEAGLQLGRRDRIETQPGAGVSEITVHRGQSVTIHDCGEILQTVAYSETVRDLLERLGVHLDDGTQLSVSPDATTFDGMELTVSRTVVSTDVYTVPLTYQTIYREVNALPQGEQVVLTEGKEGQMVCTAQVTYVNGAETSRVVLEREITRESVDRVIAVGAATGEQDSAPVIGDGVIITASGDVLTYTEHRVMEATAYSCDGALDYTATGTVARVGEIAVDPKVIPYGTRMYIVSSDGKYIYGVATAEDCGGAVKGNRIDLYFDTTDECWIFGRRKCDVYFLG